MSALYRKERARKAAFHAVFLRIPAQVATVLSYVLLVRLLPESEFGVYALLYAFVPIVGTVISLGLGHTLRRYQPEYLKQQENRLAHLLVRRIGLLRLITNALVLGLILLFWDRIAPFFKIEGYQTYFLIFAVVLLTDFQCRILNIALTSQLLHKYSVSMSALQSIVKLVGYGSAAYAFDFNLWWAFIVDGVAFFVYYVGLKYFYETLPDHTKGTVSKFSKEDRRRIVRYGAVYNFSDAGATALSGRTDNLFIAAILDPLAVGAYSFCTRLSAMIYRVSPLRLLDTVIRPMFFSLDYQKKPQKVHDYFSLLMTLAFMMRIPTFAFFVCFYREIVIVVFDGKFLEYAYLLVGVFSFSLLSAIAMPVTLVAQLREKAALILASRIFGVYNIIANLILIPRIGIAGAVVATGSATLMKNLFIWWFVRDLAVWKEGPRFALYSAVVWGAYGLLVYWGVRAVSDTPLVQLLLGLGLGIVFLFIFVRAGALTKKQQQMIARLFAGRESKVLRLFGLAA